MKITCLEILFKKILPSDCSTSKAFEVKTVQFSELLDWQLTRTVKMKKVRISRFFSQRHYICSRLRIHWHKCPHWNRPVPNIAQKYNKYLRLKKCQNSRDKDHWETWKIVEILRLNLCGKSNGNTHRTMLKSETGREKKRCNKVEAKVQFHEKNLDFFIVSHIAKLFLSFPFFTFKNKMFIKVFENLTKLSHSIQITTFSMSFSTTVSSYKV